METSPALQLLDRFAAAIEAKGIAAVPAELFISLVNVARRLDVSPVALQVLVDPTEPEVVRERAYSRVAIQVVGRAFSSRAVIEPMARPLLPA